MNKKTQEGSHFDSVREAVLTQDIRLEILDSIVFLAKGSVVTVDLKEEIAQFENYKFDISSDEFSLIKDDFSEPESQIISNQFNPAGSLIFTVSSGSDLFQ